MFKENVTSKTFKTSPDVPIGDNWLLYKSKQKIVSLIESMNQEQLNEILVFVDNVRCNKK